MDEESVTRVTTTAFANWMIADPLHKVVSQPGESQTEQFVGIVVIVVLNIWIWKLVDNMNILEELGIKIPNVVIVKDIIKGQTADEVIEFLAQYGKILKVEFIDELTAALWQVLIVEYDSGAAVAELRKTRQAT